VRPERFLMLSIASMLFGGGVLIGLGITLDATQLRSWGAALWVGAFLLACVPLLGFVCYRLWQLASRGRNKEE